MSTAARWSAPRQGEFTAPPGHQGGAPPVANFSSGSTISFGGAKFSGGTDALLNAEFSGGSVSFGEAKIFDGTIRFGGARFSGGVGGLGLPLAVAER